MDIKDFILLFGCLLIVAVIGHGLWMAGRARKETLPLAIGKGPPNPGLDGREPYEAELPNGGARRSRNGDGTLTPEDGSQQGSSLPPEGGAGPHRRGSAGPRPGEHAAAMKRANEELLGQRTVPAAPSGDLFAAEEGQDGRAEGEDAVSGLGDDGMVTARAVGVADVTLPTSGDDPLTTEHRSANRVAESARHFEHREDAATAHATPSASDALEEQPSVDDAPDDLIVIQLLAPEGETFAGNVLCASLRQHGLRYGEKSLFHRLRDDHEGPLFSVVNVIEPGFFDLGQLDTLNTPGIAFFMTLPGPVEPVKAFDDMVRIARRLAGALNGRLVDDSLNQFTAQTRAHLRERVAGHRLRHYSRKAL